MRLKIIKLEKGRKYPICPECGKHTIVGYTPPKEPMDFSKYPSYDYWDFDKAELYCCNGSSNCNFRVRFKDLTTPLSEKK